MMEFLKIMFISNYLGKIILVGKEQRGVCISIGRPFMMMLPHQVIFPAIFIFITTFGFSMLGDGMRNVIGSGRSN